MRFWAIEARPGELLIDEAVVAEAVRRILGITTTVEALSLFTSKMSLDGFVGGFLAAAEGAGSRQELEATFGQELKTIAGAIADGAPDPGTPSSTRSH